MIPIEQPPEGTDADMADYIVRQLVTINTALQRNRFNPQYVLPNKLFVGLVVYFGDAILPDITQEGLWLYKSTGWELLG